MAEGTDTLGDFKIRIETQGVEKVRSDLDSVRAGLRSLSDDFRKSSEEARKLRNEMSSMRLNGGFGAHSPLGLSASSSTSSATPTPSVGNIEPADRGSGSGTPSPAANPADVERRGFYKAFSDFTKFFKKNGKDSNRSLLEMARMMRAGNAFGSSGIAGLAGHIATLGRLLGSLAAPLGAITAVAGAGMKWTEMDLERTQQGKNIFQDRAQRKRQMDTKAVDYDAVDQLSRTIRESFAVYNEKGYDAEASARAAHNAAMQSEGAIATDMSLFKTRGRISQWQRAMLMQNQDISDVTDSQTLMTKLASMKDSLSDDQWRTFVSEAGLPQYMMDAVAEGKAGLKKRRMSQDANGHGESSYDSHWMRGDKALGIESATSVASDLYKQSGVLNDKNVVEERTTADKTLRSFSRALDNIRMELKRLKANFDRNTTIGANKYARLGSGAVTNSTSMPSDVTSDDVRSVLSGRKSVSDYTDGEKRVAELMRRSYHDRGFVPNSESVVNRLNDVSSRIDENQSQMMTGAGNGQDAQKVEIKFEINESKDAKETADAVLDALNPYLKAINGRTTVLGPNKK